jgi:hypothetical protein
MPKNEFLIERVKRMDVVFLNLLENWERLDGRVQKLIETGVNKAYGQAVSCYHEYKLAKKTLEKDRKLITQKNGDISVGQEIDVFAKTIEAKSITAPTLGAVNKLLREGMNQLGGATGFEGRSKDTRVLDLKIDGDNPWPMPGGAYETSRKSVELSKLKDTAKKELSDILFLPGAESGVKDLLKWLNEESHLNSKLKDNIQIGSLAASQEKYPNSSKKLLIDQHKNVAFLRCFTIKIRYKEGYPVLGAIKGGADIYLKEIAFQVYKKIGQKKADLYLSKTVHYEEANENPGISAVIDSAMDADAKDPLLVAEPSNTLKPPKIREFFPN